MPNLLAVDIGFAKMGCCVLCIRERGYDLVYSRVCRTAPSKKVLGIRSANDNVRRSQEITRYVTNLIDEHQISVVALELPSMGAKSAKAMRAMGLACGVIAALDVVYSKIPFLYVTPSDVKVALSGNKTASKEELQVIAGGMYPKLFNGVTKTDKEHVADAIGVSQSVLEDPVLQVLRSTL